MTQPAAPLGARPTLPVVVLVSAEHADPMTDAFWRYSREYDLRTAGSAREATEILRS